MAKETTALKMPTPEQVRAAKERKQSGVSAQSLQYGHVVGLDYNEWAVAIVNLTNRPERIVVNRAQVLAKGYVLLEGELVVIGYKAAEVYVKPRAEYERDKEARGDRQRQLVREKRLHESALGRQMHFQ